MGQLEHSASEMPYIYHLTLWILCASAFVSGIGFAYAHQTIPLAFICIVLSAFYMLTQSFKATCLLPLLFFIGYISLMHQQTQHARIVTQIENKEVNLNVYIESVEPVQHTLYRYLITGCVKQTEDIKNNTLINEPWYLQCYAHNAPRFEIGDTVTFQNITIGQTTGGSFYNYLIKEHIHATTFLKTDNYQIIHHPTFHVQRSLHRYKYDMLDRLRIKCPRITFTLFASIFLGNRNCVKKHYQDIKEHFHHWGIMHFLARSGLHLVIFILLLQLLLQYLPIPFLIKHLLILSITIIYATLSWQSVSFARACATFSWCKLCHFAGLQINITHTVLLLSFLFLLFNPSLLFFLDFQLSFGLTLILSLANQLGATKKQLSA